MAVDHSAIRKILGEQDKSADTSLRAHSMQRALKKKVPTTLTPYEWEQWYAEHGVPDSHRENGDRPRRAWWQFWRS